MILLKELWVYHILPQLSPLDLAKFQRVSKWCLEVTKPFLYSIETWKNITIDRRFNSGLYHGCRDGSRDLVDFCISRGADDWNMSLYYASKFGHLDLVKLFIEHGASHYGWGLEAAGIHNHRKIFDFLTTLVPDNAQEWNSALYGAACGGNRELVDICISRGATRWDMGLQGAKRNDHKDLIAFFEVHFT